MRRNLQFCAAIRLVASQARGAWRRFDSAAASKILQFRAATQLADYHIEVPFSKAFRLRGSGRIRTPRHATAASISMTLFAGSPT